jgi:hypothetical protein
MRYLIRFDDGFYYQDFDFVNDQVIKTRSISLATVYTSMDVALGLLEFLFESGIQASVIKY